MMPVADARALQDVSFWRELLPDLSLDEPSSRSISGVLENPQKCDLTSISDGLHKDGYFRLPPVFSARDLTPLRQAIATLQGAGIPPVFIYMYDAPWALFHALSPLVKYFLGDQFALLPNFWAWNIPLDEGARGWPPHQDCTAKTRFSDSGDPGGHSDAVIMSLSLWIPLSDATIHNGCMSVLPRELTDQVPGDGTLSDDLLAKGVALPAQAGSVLGWTQDVYHWSNPVTDQAPIQGNNPRMSLSLEFQNRSFEPLAEPLLDISRAPSFTDRLTLIAGQIPKYQHMEPMDFVWLDT